MERSAADRPPGVAEPAPHAELAAVRAHVRELELRGDERRAALAAAEARIAGLEQELAAERARADDGWNRYHVLRGRKVVRAALRLTRG